MSCHARTEIEGCSKLYTLVAVDLSPALSCSAGALSSSASGARTTSTGSAHHVKHHSDGSKGRMNCIVRTFNAPTTPGISLGAAVEGSPALFGPGRCPFLLRFT